MMRYIVFAYDQWYPLGGASDIQLVTGDNAEAYELWRELCSPDAQRRFDYVEVYDTVKGALVYEKM